MTHNSYNSTLGTGKAQYRSQISVWLEGRKAGGVRAGCCVKSGLSRGCVKLGLPGCWLSGQQGKHTKVILLLMGLFANGACIKIEGHKQDVGEDMPVDGL